MVLQRLRNLHSPCSIAIGFDHAHKLGFGFHERTIEVEVVNHSVEVHLKRGLMHLAHKQLGEMVEAKLSCSLQQDNLVVQMFEHLAGYESLNRGEEALLTDVYAVGVFTEVGAYTYKLLHATLHSQS